MKKKDYVNILNKSLASESPENVLSCFINGLGDKTAMSSSLGPEDQVLTDMLVKIDKNTNIFTLDTGRLFPETYNLIDRTSIHYGIKIRIYFPDSRLVQEMVEREGVNLFYDSIEKRKKCCHVRKLEPLERAFSGLDAWICGLRREQSVTRKDMKLIEWDETNGLIKVNPLIDWTEKQVWNYIHKNNVPYNNLHDKGFPSIGCQPCTRTVEQGDDSRSGRWWWESAEHRECGLHKR